MNKRLEYHADKMKLVCILFAGETGVFLLKSIFNSGNIWYLHLLSLIFLGGPPLAVSTYIYKIGSKKFSSNKTLEFFVLAQAVLAAYNIVMGAISLYANVRIRASYISEKEMNLNLIQISLGIICSIIMLAAYAAIIYCIKSYRFDKLFELIRILIVVSSSIYCLTMHVKPEETINVVASVILLFGVFSPEPSIEEQLKKLNDELSAGTLDKEQYDEQRQKLLEKL